MCILFLLVLLRKTLDEQISVEELGMLVSPDSINLHKLVEGFIVEAAIKVHANAPAIFLDGVIGKEGEDYVVEPSGKVLTIKMKKDCIRIASIQAKDSDYVISDLVAEDSAMGRMQLNPYTRGTYDDPRAVLMKRWDDDYLPIVKYYSLKDEIAADDPEPAEGQTEEQESVVTLEYIPYPVIDETIVMVSPRLEYNVLNEVVAMVLDALNQHDKAQIYRAKAQSYGE